MQRCGNCIPCLVVAMGSPGNLTPHHMELHECENPTPLTHPTRIQRLEAIMAANEKVLYKGEWTERMEAAIKRKNDRAGPILPSLKEGKK